MSDHDHDQDDHAPIANGDEPAAAARVRALEALFVDVFEHWLQEAQ